MSLVETDMGRAERRFLRKHRRHARFETDTGPTYRYMHCRRCEVVKITYLDGGLEFVWIECTDCGTLTQFNMPVESGNCPTCGRELFSDAVSH